MKTLQAVYHDIIENDELKKAYVKAVREGKLGDFIKAQDCDATEEEVRQFLREKAEEDRPLGLEDMKKVAGGLCSTHEDTRGCSVECTTAWCC